jgi:hypothetical protein
VLTELGLGTVNKLPEEKVPNYAYAFHLLADNLDKLLATLKACSKEVAQQGGR